MTHHHNILGSYLSRVSNDAKLAGRLLARFGDLGGVASAEREGLLAVDGMTEDAAEFVGLIRPIAEEMAREAVMGRQVISSWSALVNYCRVAMAHLERERFRVLFLDRKNKLIADEVLGEGTIDHAPVYPREVARRALMVNASAIILVHNHPSGDATPSQADIDMTRTLKEVLTPFEIVIHDHLVIGRENTVSFKTLGLM